MPGGFPPGMMDSDSWIAKMISGDMFGGKMSITPEQIKEAMRSINLDDYRDEEGVVRCPLSKAEREALIDKLR
ncbi:MAG: hypothetical protein GY732_18225 [Gammaproteobacteria bacterium]|nr:hypothetical protein [Gammaproteobacteria bacterium]